MHSSLIAVLVISLFIAAAFGLMVINMSRSRKNSFRDEVSRRWGVRCGEGPEHYPELCHMHYADSCPFGQESSPSPDYFTVDDITWQDIEMDRVAAMLNQAWTTPGFEVLISWLRHPALSSGSVLEKRERLITWLEKNEQERIKVAEILYNAGLSGEGSVYDALSAFQDAKEVNTIRFIIPSVLTLFGLVGLFIRPLASLALLIVVFIVNFRIQMDMQSENRNAAAGFSSLESLLKTVERLQNEAFDSVDLSGLLKEAGDAAGAFKDFRRGAFLLTAGAGTGIGHAIFTYVNLFFHLDRFLFNRMLRSVRLHFKEAVCLFRTVGTIDAAWSAASYREGGSDWCRPELRADLPGITMKGMHHPLMKTCVPNDCVTDTGFLITGSNASGKSTYLKGCALAAVLAQSIATVPAVSYSAPFFSVFTSIALTDNLRGGESYYIVEIRSLKRILDASSQGSRVLAMADEVLRGTNTIERIASSAAVIRKLCEEKVIILAATHDHELSYLLETVLPNRHFGEVMAEGDIAFDYTLQEGRADGRNAIRLLAEAGFSSDVTGRAADCAAHFEETGEWRL